MSLTLLAIFMLPLCLKLVLDPEGTHKILKDWGASRGLQFMTTTILFGLSMLIFLTTPLSFKLSWDSLMGWFGIAIALKGIACLFPKFADFKVRLLTEERIPMVGLLGLMVILAMIYLDTQII